MGLTGSGQFLPGSQTPQYGSVTWAAEGQVGAGGRRAAARAAARASVNLSGWARP